MNQINEQITFGKSASMQKIFFAKRLLLPNKLLLKSYIFSGNLKFVDIPCRWELFVKEKVNHN